MVREGTVNLPRRRRNEGNPAIQRSFFYFIICDSQLSVLIAGVTMTLKVRLHFCGGGSPILWASHCLA